jgi:transcriptional regulator with GAF, ATPase, and Fis domain
MTREDQAIEERLRFERFLSDLAAKLLNVEPEKLDTTIQKSLEDLAGVLGGERCGIGQFSEDGRTLLFSHGWAASHVSKILIGADLAAALPWYAGEIRKGRAVLLPRLPDDFPEDALPEREFATTVGLKSNFTLPLKAGGEVVGGLGIDYYAAYRNWSPELRARMELLASVYANAFYRRRALARLHRAHDLNHSVLASVSSEVLVIDRDEHVLAFNDAWARSAHSKQFPEVTQDSNLPDTIASDTGCLDAPTALDGIRSVASGQQSRFEMLCRHTGCDRTRVYLLTATPLAVEAGGAVVTHTEVTELEDAKAHLEKSLQEACELKERLEAENVVLQQQVRRVQGFDEVVGTSGVLGHVLTQVEQVAPTDSPVLILGETGTGKELIARALHERSRRQERPLVTINCAALPPTLIESEVFGYEKGAFTGAHHRTLGRFEVAHGGSLFLDEIGELPVEVQAKLLRVLETGELERLGSSKTIKVDVRVIAATNRDLEREVRERRFRADLYYRLSVFPITLPPLRGRREDIPVLVWHFIMRKQGNLGKAIKHVPERLMNAFTTYSWPGNVRELENVIERSLIMTSGTTLATDPLFRQGASESQSSTGATLAELERAHILSVLEECGWKISGKSNAADRLGLKRSTLQFRMKKLGIQRPVHGS